MTDQEKLFNIIKLICTLLYKDSFECSRSYDLDNCGMLLTKSQNLDVFYISHKSNNLLVISYHKESKRFICWNTFGDEMRYDEGMLTMDFTQYNLSYGRLNDFMLGTIYGLYLLYDEIIDGIGNQLL